MPRPKKKVPNKVESMIDDLSKALDEVSGNPPPREKEKQDEEKVQKYVVVRDNRRVSDIEYENPKDPAAIAERDFWMRVVAKFPDGTKVGIVPYNNKIHRVY